MGADSLGDRMKENYENRSRNYLVRRTPVIIRVDGQAFHTFTKGFDRPFDQDIINAMVDGALDVCEHIQGCQAAYIQSDEASFLITDYTKITTNAWFDYNKSKIESISASVMTLGFNLAINDDIPTEKNAYFDSRSFNIPKEEVVNYFLWRMKDWERNSVTMYCGSFFSHKQMHGKGRADQHEMLFSVGKNWTKDLSPQIKNGTWLYREKDKSWTMDTEIKANYAEIHALVSPLVYKVDEDD